MFKSRKKMVTEELSKYRDFEEFRKVAEAQAEVIDSANKSIIFSSVMWCAIGIYYGVFGYSLYKEYMESKELDDTFENEED